MCRVLYRGGALESPPLPRKFENLYSLILMHDAVAVPHKLLPLSTNPVWTLMCTVSWCTLVPCWVQSVPSGLLYSGTSYELFSPFRHVKNFAKLSKMRFAPSRLTKTCLVTPSSRGTTWSLRWDMNVWLKRSRLETTTFDCFWKKEDLPSLLNRE